MGTSKRIHELRSMGDSDGIELRESSLCDSTRIPSTGAILGSAGAVHGPNRRRTSSSDMERRPRGSPNRHVHDSSARRSYNDYGRVVRREPSTRVGPDGYDELALDELRKHSSPKLNVQIGLGRSPGCGEACRTTATLVRDMTACPAIREDGTVDGSSFRLFRPNRRSPVTAELDGMAWPPCQNPIDEQDPCGSLNSFGWIFYPMNRFETTDRSATRQGPLVLHSQHSTSSSVNVYRQRAVDHDVDRRGHSVTGGLPPNESPASEWAGAHARGTRRNPF